MRFFLATALAMLAFAANSVLNRLAVGGAFIDPMAFAVIRLAAGAAMLALLVALRWRRAGRPFRPGPAGRLAGVAGLLVYLFGFSLAYRHLDAGLGALILFGSVQVTMFGGALWSREPVPPRRWAGAALAFAGLLVLLAPLGGVAPGMAAVPMLAAGVGWGIYSLAGRGQADALGATAANFVLALPVALLAAALVPMGWGSVTATGAGLAAVSGAVTSGLGYALWYAVVPRLGAARAAIAQMTVPLIAAAGGLALIGEPVGLRFLLALVLVVAGVALASLPGQSRRSSR